MGSIRNAMGMVFFAMAVAACGGAPMTMQPPSNAVDAQRAGMTKDIVDERMLLGGIIIDQKGDKPLLPEPSPRPPAPEPPAPLPEPTLLEWLLSIVAPPAMV